jgi:hypothetical protein
MIFSRFMSKSSIAKAAPMVPPKQQSLKRVFRNSSLFFFTASRLS